MSDLFSAFPLKAGYLGDFENKNPVNDFTGEERIAPQGNLIKIL